ncbi:hypothetical protein [Curtobacterium sp. VKM Ac-1376]|uniref:hypothetical protein n=1 Tax=Curtobacterium sp. VKM Ac-1376 TaxID=123312 RepID=UPI00188C4AB6|nr:hypothetical protein [Curtobacterium sp. VKM Ac-1376]MBF4616236.1 hypothetical protein [Curtobacterium sp. VKM Ac-1376]
MTGAVPATTRRLNASVLARVAVWVVFALLFGYMTVQAAGNLSQIAQRVEAFNAFLATTSGGDSLQTSTPWLWLVLDIVIAPVAFVAAVVITRRASLPVTLAVFVVAFAGAGALWLDLQLFVPTLLDF